MKRDGSGERDGGGFERERWERKVREVGLDRDAGGDEWDGRCRIGVFVLVSVMVVVGSVVRDPPKSTCENAL